MSNYFVSLPNINPKIYGYKIKTEPNLIKIGYTKRDTEERILEQFPVKGPRNEKPFEIVFDKPAVRGDGSFFTDKDIHEILKRNGYLNTNGEWFECNISDLENAYKAILNNSNTMSNVRTESFELRQEQKEAIEKTKKYFLDNANEEKIKFLWNAKMRFGKCFTSYKFIEEMGYKNVLILTFKPGVKSSWENDLVNHKDFKDYQFIYGKTDSPEIIDKTKKIICFGSFQDLLQKNKYGAIKFKNIWIHNRKWDLVIIDEYHFGAWREKSKDLFSSENDSKQASFYEENINDIPIKCNKYLYLSGTPFRALSDGEFMEYQIFNWTYIDEQLKKEEYKNKSDNLYEAMPKMLMMTYNLPDELREIAISTDNDEFSLSEFFKAEKKDQKYVFVYENYVNKFLNFLSGNYINATSMNDVPLPFNSSKLSNYLNHTFWLLPNVASCNAMKDLLKENNFFRNYEVILAAGSNSKSGDELIDEIHEKIGNPFETKTITLSCQKLTTGVTIKPWTGIFMLRTLNAPETYYQACFRVQTPWTIKNKYIDSFEEQIIKKNCYVFDFDPNRALRQVVEYSSKLNINESNVKKKVEEFIKFFPILAFVGNEMHEVDATGILDFTMSQTTYGMLVRKWETPTIVNVDNATLSRVLQNEDAMRALEKIEGFRNLNKNISIIISKNEEIKKLKTKSIDSDLTKKEIKELDELKKEELKNRKFIQKKLIKFITRIPVFMYLTDYREESLKDIIMELEPQLFEKVTGLTIKDFDLLISLNLFNDKLMNEAIYHFKMYENSSLEYSGILKHNTTKIGLFNTTIRVDNSEN